MHCPLLNCCCLSPLPYMSNHQYFLSFQWNFLQAQYVKVKNFLQYEHILQYVFNVCDINSFSYERNGIEFFKARAYILKAFCVVRFLYVSLSQRQTSYYHKYYMSFFPSFYSLTHLSTKLLFTLVQFLYIIRNSLVTILFRLFQK